jgi:hypothetical protein
MNQEKKEKRRREYRESLATIFNFFQLCGIKSKPKVSVN